MQLSAGFQGCALAVVAIAGCANHVDGSADVPALPIAQLTCPAHAEAGVAFTVDGTASKAPAGGFKTTSLSVVPAPGNDPVDGLTGSFTEAAAGVATAKLVVTDRKGNTAEARCRIVVGPHVDVGEGEGEGEGAVGGDDVDLTGSFALLAYDMPQIDDDRLDPAEQCGAAPQLALVDVAQTGKHVSLSMTACALSFPDVQVAGAGVQHVDVPQALVDALPAISAELDLASATPGSPFAPPLTELGVGDVVGARLDDPTNDVLPTDATDPRLSDDDGDGYPGATVKSGAAADDIVFRRTLRAMSGTIVSADLVDGSTPGDWQCDSDATVVDGFFTFPLPALTGLPSTFRMVRVDDTTCAGLLGHADALWSTFPAPSAPDGCAEF